MSNQTLRSALQDLVDAMTGRMDGETVALHNAIAALANKPPTFANGTLVRKRSGSQWEGHIVGRYSTGFTPDGYAVESITHAGSVQIYPAHALELVNRDCCEAGCAEDRCGTASCLKGGS